MSKEKSYREVLEFAIEREQEAQRDYEAAAKTVKDAPMRDALLEMAAQERGHEKKLRGLNVGSSSRRPRSRCRASTSPSTSSPASSTPA